MTDAKTSERDLIVAWLRRRSTEARENADLCEYEDDERWWVDLCEAYAGMAKRIERGDHLRKEPPDDQG